MERFLDDARSAAHGEAQAPRRGVQAIALGAAGARRRWCRSSSSCCRTHWTSRRSWITRTASCSAHLKIADRNGARYALILGSEELAAGELVLRDLEARSDARLPLGSTETLPPPSSKRASDGTNRRRETETLQRLLALMHEHDLDRIKVKLGDAVYEFVRAKPAPAIVGAGGRARAASYRRAGRRRRPCRPAHVKRVVAPLTGVFYRSSSPDADAVRRASATASTTATCSASSKR